MKMQSGKEGKASQSFLHSTRPPEYGLGTLAGPLGSNRLCHYPCHVVRTAQSKQAGKRGDGEGNERGRERERETRNTHKRIFPRIC